MIVDLLGMGAAVKPGPRWRLLSGVAAERTILLPSTLLMVMASLSWNRLRHSSGRLAYKRAMGPITLGILWAVGPQDPAHLQPRSAGRAGVVAGVQADAEHAGISPLWFMAVAGVRGAQGWVNR